jgi:hypothetical protein
MVYPPRYGNISIPAVVAGNILQSDDTSISVTDVGFDGHIVMKTQNTIAMLINQDQSVSIGTELITSRLTINNPSPSTSTLRLSYQNSFFFDSWIESSGNIAMVPSCNDPLLNSNLTVAFQKNLNVVDHNGSTVGLRLGGILVTATATKLNYNDVTAGTAGALKTLVLDASRNITGINYLSAASLTGTLTSGPQWGITEVDTLNIRTQLSLNGSVVVLSPAELAYLNIITPGIAQPTAALVIDSGYNISNIGHLSANSLTGVLTVGPQPNITSLSGLATLNVYGLSTFRSQVTINTGSGPALCLKYDDSNYTNINVSSLGEMQISTTGGLVFIQNGSNFKISSHNGASAGLFLGTQLVIASGAQLNYNAVNAGTAAAGRSLVLDGSKNIVGINVLGATILEGTLGAGSQPNIISVNTLDIVNHNGNTTGLSLAGTLITATATKINYIDTTPGSAQASKSLVVDSVRSITNINSLTASTLTGTIMTTNQPNIAIVQTLRITNHNGSSQGLMLGSVLVTASANQLNYLTVNSGVGIASKALILDTNKSIIGINNLVATTLAGTLSTSSQPNINLVNILDIELHNGGTQGLSLGGVLITVGGSQINRLNVISGIGVANKVMILNSSGSIAGINTLSAALLSGTLTSAAQTNIRILHSINIEDHNGTTAGLSLGGILVLSTADQLNALAVIPGSAIASRAIILDSSKGISGISTLSATNIYATIRTVVQPYIASVNILNIALHDGSTQGLSLGGTLVSVTADQINKLSILDGFAAASKALILNASSSISGINLLSATSLSGVLITTNQPNIGSVNSLNIAYHNGSTTGLSLLGTLVTASAAQINQLNTTPGVAVASKAMLLDSNLNYIGLNNLSATTLTGVVNTGSQPYITSVNTLNISTHDGGSQGLKLNNILVIATANQLNATAVVPGVATSSRALVTNDANSITGVNQLTVNKLTANQLVLSGVISNFNTNGVIIKTYSKTNMSGRVVDVQLLSNLTFQNFQPAAMTNSFSSEIIGYIQPAYSETYTFYVSCNDRVRMWVNDVLILHSWISINTYRTTTPIFLNAGQWVKLYIQYQVDAISTSLLNIQWSSNSTTRDNIPSSVLAWDSNQPANDSNHYTQNTLTIYNSSTSAANLATMTVDTSGDLTIDASGNNLTLGSADSFNIPSHDGSTQGLSLAGVLVLPTAYEINYLKVTPGQVVPSKALVVDASKALFGINSLTATTIACTNLSASNFTINNLALSGPLNNYSTGSLLIREISGPDMTGRIVDVNTITDINLTNYDPQGLSANYSLDIIGYIKPTYTESYTFYAVANDRVRIWVNNVLVLNVWDTTTGLEYTSNTIQMTANQWTPIYIQYQNITDTGTLIVRWSSITLPKSFIPSNSMAWDNSMVKVPLAMTAADSLTLFSSTSGLTSIRSGQLSVDSIGNLSLASSSGTVSVATNNNINIISHNGTHGLHLAGSLVTSTAIELNRIGGVTPGTTLANKAIILDSSKAVAGLSSITCDNLYSVVRIAAQPYITSIGTLASTLISSSDVLLGTITLFRLATNSTTSLISSSATTTTDSSADLFIGNYGTDPTTSSRKFMIKASGALGIQTNTPNKMLSINGAGADYAMRLINNNAIGAETNYADFGTDSNGLLSIAPSGTTINLLANLSIGKTSPATITVTSGVLNIAAASVQIGNSTNTIIPLEVGSASFTLTGTVGFLNNTGAVGSFSTAPTTYSIRTTSSIIVNGTVCVTSDKRLKEDIIGLDVTRCRKFIMDSNPVSFKYKTDRLKKRFGLIAQDVAQTEFKELVQFTPDTIEASNDDGFMSPVDACMNVSYMEIIPILMATVKDLYQKNAELQAKVDQLYNERT